jgi:hypothetical protein
LVNGPIDDRRYLWTLLPCAIVLCLAAGLRGAEYDEQYTLFLTSGVPRPDWPVTVFPAGLARDIQAGHAGLAAIGHDLRVTDVHPPLYFWLVSLWRDGLGQGLFIARLLSVLLGVGSLALTGVIARTARLPPVWAMLLTLGCYGFTYASVVARGFALAQLLLLGGVAWLLLGRRGWHFALAGALLGAATLSNYLSVFAAGACLLAVGLDAVWTRHRPRANTMPEADAGAPSPPSRAMAQISAIDPGRGARRLTSGGSRSRRICVHPWVAVARCIPARIVALAVRACAAAGKAEPQIPTDAHSCDEAMDAAAVRPARAGTDPAAPMSRAAADPGQPDCLPPPRPPSPRHALAALAGFLVFIPADLWWFLAQRGSRQGQFPPFSLTQSLARLAVRFTGDILGGLPLYVAGAASLLLTATLGALLIWLLARIVWRWHRIAPPRARVMFALAALAPAAGLLALGALFNNTPIEVRYLTFSNPFVGLLLAGALGGRGAAAVFAVQAASIAGLMLAPQTMQPARAAAHAAASWARDGVVLLPRGNDGVGVVGAFAIESPPALPLLLIPAGATPEQIRARLGPWHRVVLALLEQDAASRAASEAMRRALNAPGWREVAHGPNVAVYERDGGGV